MPRTRLVLAATAGCLGVAVLAPATYGSSPESLQETGRVTYITDGDTVDVQIGSGAAEPVRLLGVQAMEAVHPSVPGSFDACHAAAARAALAALVSGRDVQLWSQSPDSENRGRLLRSVIVPEDGSALDVQRELLQDSLVLPFPSVDEPSHNLEYLTLAQQVSKGGAGIWNTTSCGSGPAQTVPLKLIVNYDAYGDDTTNVNGEWVSIQNLSATKSINLAGWWVRDSSLAQYTFPSGTVVGPKARVTVKVGKGTNSTISKYWGRSTPVFDNGGDGAYLFDPDGDLRAWMMYPCLTQCTDLNQGRLVIKDVEYDAAGSDARNVNGEWVKISNVGPHKIRLRPYVVRSAPYSYTFSPDLVLDPGETLVLRVGRGTATAHTAYWGRTAPILGNSGDRVELMTYDGIRLSCKAWGSYSC